MRNLILFSFLGAIGYYIYSNIKSIDLITTKITGVNISGGLLNLQMMLGIDITNPTGYNINFQELQAGVFLNNDQIGNINYNMPVLLNSNTITPVEIPININPLYAAGTLLNTLQQGNIIIEVIGEIKAENVKTYYYENYKII